MKRYVFIVFASCCLFTSVFAADQQAVVEETSPPVAEGALTPDQLPPLMSAIKQAPQQIQEPVTQQ
jgi:hypothetical protein